MDQKERMLANLPYKSWMDGLSEDRMECKKKLYKYNNLPPDETAEREKLLREILGKTKEGYLNIESPFHCDYGYNIEVGSEFFANYNFIVLDVGKVRIGDHFMCGPNVSICTAGHPVHPESRNSGYEYGIDITIGDNVWIGGNVMVCPGVTIGNNVVIGAGSIVTHDIPANSVAIGAPARVVKPLPVFLEAKSNEMNPNNTFDEEYTLRNTEFKESHREKLIDTCRKFGHIYVK
jgi:acetyltransferase-like isoleucine patch superfamily enzyme